MEVVANMQISTNIDDASVNIDGDRCEMGYVMSEDLRRPAMGRENADLVVGVSAGAQRCGVCNE